MQGALGTGDGDVGESALLRLLAVADGSSVREAALLGAGDPDVVELEALGAVDRAQDDRVIGDAALVAGERDLGEEAGDAGALGATLVRARMADEGAQVRELAPRAPARRPASGAAHDLSEAVGLAGGDQDGDDVRADRLGPGRERPLGVAQRRAQRPQRVPPRRG